MLDFIYYLFLTKEIALILINVVVLVLASVFMIVGLFTCLRSLKKGKKKLLTLDDVLKEKLKDPEFKREYLLETARQALRERGKIIAGRGGKPVTQKPKVEFKDASTGKKEKWEKKIIWVREDGV